MKSRMKRRAEVIEARLAVMAALAPLCGWLKGDGCEPEVRRLVVDATQDLIHAKELLLDQLTRIDKET